MSDVDLVAREDRSEDRRVHLIELGVQAEEAHHLPPIDPHALLSRRTSSTKVTFGACQELSTYLSICQ